MVYSFEFWKNSYVAHNHNHKVVAKVLANLCNLVFKLKKTKKSVMQFQKKNIEPIFAVSNKILLRVYAIFYT